MKIKLGCKAAFLMTVAILGLPSGMAQATDFEVLPTFQAATVLGAESIKGENYVVEDVVTNDGTMNQFTITSPDISLKALGNEHALERSREMEAIAAIRKIKKTDAYIDGFAAAIGGPLNSAKEAITNPIRTLENIPGAIEQFMGDIFSAVGNLGNDEAQRKDDSMIKDLIGYNKTKRRLAYDLGVDPYSSNPVLQEELGDLAWTGFAGGATIDVALAATTTGVGTALGAMDRVTASDDLLRENSISSLANISRRHLLAMGLDETSANKFLINPNYPVSLLTRMIQALGALENVPGRNDYMVLAETAKDENDARFHQRTAEIIAAYHQQVAPVIKVFVQANKAFFVDNNGLTIMPLQADYMVWTTQTAEAMTGLLSAPGNRSLWLTGSVSPMTQEQLSAKNIGVQPKVFAKLTDRINIVTPADPTEKAREETTNVQSTETKTPGTEAEAQSSEENGLLSFFESVLKPSNTEPIVTTVKE